MIYQPVVIGIAFLSFLVLVLLVALIIKKTTRDFLYARRLWLKDHYRPLIEEFLSHNRVQWLPFREAESRKYRSIIEEILQELMKRADGVAQRKIQKLFAELGYLEFHLANLQSSNYLQRASSAEILGAMKSRKAVDALIRSLQDPEEAVRITSVRALGRIGGKKAVEALVGALQDGERYILPRVAEVLHLAGPRAVIPLIDLLEAPNAVTRALAAGVLGEIGDKRALRVLRKALLNDSPDVRVKAAAALGQIGDVRTRSALEKALRDPDWPVRSAAAKALGQLKDPTSCHLLAQALTDPAWWVRTNAAQALADLRRPGEKALIKMLSSYDQFARDKAAETLGFCGAVDKYILQLISKDRRQSHQASKTLTVLTRLGVIGPFDHHLQESRNQDLRCAIIAFLGKTGDETAYEVISKYVNDEEKAVRETAKIALQRIQSRKWAAIGEGEDQIELEQLGS